MLTIHVSGRDNRKDFPRERHQQERDTPSAPTADAAAAACRSKMRDVSTDDLDTSSFINHNRTVGPVVQEPKTNTSMTDLLDLSNILQSKRINLGFPDATHVSTSTVPDEILKNKWSVVDSPKSPSHPQSPGDQACSPGRIVQLPWGASQPKSANVGSRY